MKTAICKTAPCGVGVPEDWPKNTYQYRGALQDCKCRPSEIESIVLDSVLAVFRMKMDEVYNLLLLLYIDIIDLKVQVDSGLKIE